MATNFENFALLCDKDGNVRICKIKRVGPSKFPVVQESGPDVTYQALHCVSEHMQALYNQERAAGEDIKELTLQAEDGSRLVWYPPTERGVE